MTHKCIRSGESPKEEFPWGWISWLYNASANPDAELTFGVVEIKAGQRNQAHSHPNCEELLYVASGRCVHAVGEEEHELGPGDLVAIPRGTSHQAVVTGDEPLRAVICYSSPRRETKSEDGE